MRRKRILHVTSSLRRGGAEEVLCNLIERMDPTAFEHVVAYVHEGPHVQRLRDRGIRLYQLRGLFFRYDPVFFFRLWRLVGVVKPDVMHALLWVASLGGRLVGALRRVPCVCVMHNNADQNGAVRIRIDRLVGACGAKIVAVSEEVAQSLQWIPAEKVAVITNGIDVDAVHAQAEYAGKKRSDFGLKAEHFVFGSVGRFEPVKRYDLLLESFALVYREHPNARLLLVGQGSQEYFLRECARDLGVIDAVIFVIGQKALGYYPLFDCFVLASAKEGISIALLEAMSFKLPCVVTNSSAQHAVVQSGQNGLVVEHADVQKLACALAMVMQQPEERMRWGQEALSCVLCKGTASRMVAEYENLFSKEAEKSLLG